MHRDVMFESLLDLGALHHANSSKSLNVTGFEKTLREGSTHNSCNARF